MPAAQVTSALTFPTQSQSTLGTPQIVTITNIGGRGLSVYGLTFTGADAGDFMVTSTGCMGPIASGDSCTVGVSFAPHGQGARMATLQIASNDPNSPATVTLTGAGGQLPQGPVGQTGPTETQRSAGDIELVVCAKATKTTIKHGKEHKTTVQHCTTRLVSGTIKVTIDSEDLSASVSRARRVYATGVAVPTGAGRWQLVLTDPIRRLRSGRYNLTLRTLHGHHRIVQRTTIMIT